MERVDDSGDGNESFATVKERYISDDAIVDRAA